MTRGCDLECGSSYRTLGKALERGLLREEDLDVALRRLMLARMKLGMFDPPERVAYARIPYSVNDAPEHDRLARRVAQESIVLLKNDGVLPLRKDLGTIAVVGPNADDIVTLLGNYNGTPARPVTVLAGIRDAVSPATRVLYARGVDLVEGRQDPRAAEAIGAGLPAPGARLVRARAHRLVLPRARPPGRARADARGPDGGLPLGPRGAHRRARRAGRARRGAGARERLLLGPLDGRPRASRLRRVRADR